MTGSAGTGPGHAPLVVERRSTVLSDWVTLMERHVQRNPSAAPQAFHSLRQADYVSVLAVAPDGRIPLVRQYRPALERFTLELPGGLHEPGEAPAITAARELAEETGLAPEGELELLGCLDPDTGRLENRMWGFFAGATSRLPEWVEEPEVQVEYISAEDLKAACRDGRMRHALHIALIGLAVMGGRL